ncbi:helix-turn-helix domain-containing protein [Pseudonocardia sp. NPDC049154]|uniref:helix-turn-helix domain-containing protein n=1 Tax=Pseudonocardia sp. NPDC049154 TaxID=3155501 RepID=UPI0033EF56FA
MTAEERRQARTEQTAHRQPDSPRRAVRVAGLALIARGVSVSVVAERCGVSGRTTARWTARVSA